MPDLATPFIQGATAGQQIAQKSLQTQKMQMENQQAALTLQQNQQYAALLQKMAQGQGGQDGAQTPASPSDQMMQLGLMAMKSGLPQGVGLVNSAISAQAKLADSAASTARAQAEQLKASIAEKQFKLKQAEEMHAQAAGMLAGVHDQATWDAFAQYAKEKLNDPSYIGTPYDPQKVKGLLYEAAGVKNAIDLAKSRIAEEQKAADMQERQRHNQVEEAIGKARLAVEKIAAEARLVQAQQAAARNKRLEKVGGGKVVSPPPENMVVQAQDLIGKEVPGLHGGDKMDFAYSVASKAKALLVKNPGMDAEAALMESLSELKDEQVGTMPGDHFWQGDKTTFMPGGNKKPSTPPQPKASGLTAAEVKAQYPNAQQAKDGKWYVPLPGGKWGVIGQ